jgi:hypothetical protein
MSSCGSFRNTNTAITHERIRKRNKKSKQQAIVDIPLLRDCVKPIK